jgi:hypothetical protein
MVLTALTVPWVWFMRWREVISGVRAISPGELIRPATDYSARALDDHQRWMITPNNSISSIR